MGKVLLNKSSGLTMKQRPIGTSPKMPMCLAIQALKSICERVSDSVLIHTLKDTTTNMPEGHMYNRPFSNEAVTPSIASRVVITLQSTRTFSTGCNSSLHGRRKSTTCAAPTWNATSSGKWLSRRRRQHGSRTPACLVTRQAALKSHFQYTGNPCLRPHLCVCARAFVRQVVPELELSQVDRVYRKVDVTKGKNWLAMKQW